MDCAMNEGGMTMDAGMSFVRCHSCGVLRIPENELLHHSVDADPLAPLSVIMRLLMVLRMLWLKAVVPTLRNKHVCIGDVGCGDGQFLEFLKRSGYTNAIGIEPETDRREHSQARGVSVYRNWEAADRALGRRVTAEILFAWQVLEHIPQPAKFLNDLAMRISPQGCIIVSVPNQRALQTRLFGYYSSYPDYGRHIWYHDASYAGFISRAATGTNVKVLPNFNFEYEIFSWVDSIISFIARRQNCAHLALKKGKGSTLSRLVIALIAVAVLPLAGVLSLISLGIGRGSTLTFAISPIAMAT
jgi:SAM-dependent methyltransferase